MATISQNIFLTKKEKLKCEFCKKSIPKGSRYVAETENHKGTCFKCSEFTSYTLLPPGNAALTRRSKKHSIKCAVLFEWNPKRKRFERKGQYVTAAAIEIAKKECADDAAIRAEKNKKAALKREQWDKEYIAAFSVEIRKHYPNCPKDREYEIAKHACEKYSGRVGRTADAKNFDKNMIDLAVEAHIRHKETNYDNEFGKGLKKKQIRTNLKFDIMQIMMKWRLKPKSTISTKL